MLRDFLPIEFHSQKLNNLYYLAEKRIFQSIDQCHRFLLEIVEKHCGLQDFFLFISFYSNI